MAGMRYQPQGLLRIDRANGLARGLRLVSLPGVNAGTDMVSGAAATVTGTRRATYPGGVTCGFGSALGVNGADRIATPLTGALTERSVFVRARRNGNGGVNVGRLYDKSVGTAGQMAYWDANAQALTYHMFVNGSERLLRAPGSAAAASVGRDFDILITHAFAGNRSTVSIYVDGALSVTQDIDGALTDAPTTVLSIGNRGDGIRGWDGSIALVEAWDRVLTAGEARELSTNPWQIFAAVDDDDFAAAPIARTLSVGRASLALEAGEVGMRVSRRVRVQPSALAIAGGQALLRASRRLSLQPAALAIGAGQSGMVAARRLGVQPAVLAVAGQGAALRVERRMQVAAAPLALVAGSVAMQYSPALAPGAYTLPVSAAAMRLTGGAVGMRVTRRMAVVGAPLQLAAGAVRALVGRRLVVTLAPLVIEAGPVSVRAARRVRVSAAQLVLAGGNVQLRYSAQVAYARAPAGAGYAPQRAAITVRPEQTGGHRPPAIQETIR